MFTGICLCYRKESEEETSQSKAQKITPSAHSFLREKHSALQKSTDLRSLKIPEWAFGPVMSLLIRSDGSERACGQGQALWSQSLVLPTFMLLLKHLLVKNYYTKGGEEFLRTEVKSLAPRLNQ